MGWCQIPKLIHLAFGVELNVAGKLIYGAAQAGWTPLQKVNTA